jgi:hypothetical protein
MDSGRELLAIYLGDHRAGAAAGRALVRRMDGRYGHQPGFEEIARLRRDIEDDLDALDDLRARLDVHTGTIKRLLAIVGERLGRLKLNGRLVRHSPLSPLLELEALGAGVCGKRDLWQALMAAPGAVVGTVDLQRLGDRADDQLERLQQLHERVAATIPWDR